MKFPIAILTTALAAGNAFAAAPPVCSVDVGSEPVVIRMSKDEFRIAFGVAGDKCHDGGCAGVIRYDATWRTEDGTVNVDRKTLSYDIPSGVNQSIAVDRHYFDLGEGRHTTDLVRVAITDISCAQPRLTAGR